MTEPPVRPVSEARATAEPKPNTPGLQLWALTLALFSGVLGIIGALVQEIQSIAAVGLILIILGAPIIEELLKPSGIYILLVRWPHALRGRLHTASLTASPAWCSVTSKA